MCREICKGFLLLWTAVILLPPALFSQEAKKEGKAQRETTELRIEVTGGEESKPVKGATVYIEWKEKGETKHKEGTTNRQGIAGPYIVPRVRVFIQVTTEDNVWEKKGGDFELKEQDVTIQINLTKK